jgi:hypothetical protein
MKIDQVNIEDIDIKRVCKELQTCLTKVSNEIGEIQIGNIKSFPFGWRKSAKGRTVWRIVEESINQNLEKMYAESNDIEFRPSDSEVAMYDFQAIKKSKNKVLWTAFVNIKSSTLGAKASKDDLSKADKLLSFLQEDSSRIFFIATFSIQFNNDMTISLPACHVFPLNWLPDIYVNPSNNGNLQSSKYKNLDEGEVRTTAQFITELEKAIKSANGKRKKKN